MKRNEAPSAQRHKGGFFPLLEVKVSTEERGSIHLGPIDFFR
jgi:hypothetical protein